MNSPKENTSYNQFNYTANNYVLYSGYLKDCLKNFRLQSLDILFKRLQKEIANVRRESEFQENSRYWNRGWKEDYFNTITDGQLGDYDDFSGNIDDIDTWSGG